MGMCDHHQVEGLESLALQVLKRGRLTFGSPAIHQQRGSVGELNQGHVALVDCEESVGRHHACFFPFPFFFLDAFLANDAFIAGCRSSDSPEAGGCPRQPLVNAWKLNGFSPTGPKRPPLVRLGTTSRWKG